MYYVCCVVPLSFTENVLPTIHAVTTSFAAKLVLFFRQIDVKVYLTNFSEK